jgi:predicted metal-dependent phosphoesterase TrpH
VRADLHTHTTASDGTLSPEELVELAERADLDAIAVSDHDSIEGVGPALKASRDRRVTVIPAVELSAYDDGLDVHILGYHVDHHDVDLQSMLLRLRHARLERAVAMIDSLGSAGYPVQLEDVLELARASATHGSSHGSVGRAHIARALVEAGHVSSVQDAFERLIGRERPHFVRKPLSPPSEVVRAITAAGGLPVLAHPVVNGADRLIGSLVAHGLAGIEAFHFEHTDEQAASLERLAREEGLIVTGGSDFHGPEGPGPGLGAILAPPDAVGALAGASSHP